MMHQDPTARATHYELTELGDETRHMVMFGKAIERVGAKPVRPRLYQRMIINALPLAFRDSLLWVAALIGEEIFDSLQRQMMDDPDLQPMVQRLMRIHVTEEARHIQFARDGLRKRAPHMRRINKLWVANLNGIGGVFFQYLFTNPAPYRRVGLDAARSSTRRSAKPASARGADRRVRTAGSISRGGRVDGPDRATDVEAQPLPVSDIDDVAFLDAERIAGLNPSFDESTHTWTLRSPRANRLAPRVLIATDGAMPDGGRPRWAEPRPLSRRGCPRRAELFPDHGLRRCGAKELHREMFAGDGGTAPPASRCGTARSATSPSGGESGIRTDQLAARRQTHPVVLSTSARTSPSRTMCTTAAPPSTSASELPHARVRLTGHFDPIDGHYHWQGTILEQLPGTEKLPQPATVTVGNRICGRAHHRAHSAGRLFGRRRRGAALRARRRRGGRAVR